MIFMLPIDIDNTVRYETHTVSRTTRSSNMTAEVNTFRTYIQAQGQLYAAGRPGYSPDLFKIIIDHHVSTGGHLNTVVDAGCGTGQATRDLAPYFSNAIGLDPSERMICTGRETTKTTYPPIRFEISTGEALGTDLEPPIADGSVDLITAATAAHWFDMASFWAAAVRILQPGGTVALWARTAMAIDPNKTPNGPAIKAVVDEVDRALLPHDRLGTILTRDLYADLPLPWNIEKPVVEFEKESLVRKEWNMNRDYVEGDGDLGLGAAVSLEQLEALMGTNSSVTRWREANPEKNGTEEDPLRVMGRRVESLLDDVGVNPGERVLRGGVAIVLLMVKKR